MQNTPGTQLAKVLYYYGLIESTESDEQKIVCPFHEDVNPSLKINLQDGSWYCFGCGLSGDALKFVMLTERKYHKLNDLQAAQKFGKILKSKKTESINIGTRQKKPKESEQSMTEAKDYYFNLSQDNWTKKPEDKEKRESILYMKQRGFSFKVLTEIGCKYTFNRNYPLVFPMFDNAEFKGWVCRTTDKNIEKKRKYLYNEGFSRRNTLCGQYDLLKNVPLYIVEGYMDMLKLKSFGIKNVVAILGWKLTSEQLLKLKKEGFKHIISALDNDVCGKKGSQYLKQFFKVTRFAFEDGIKDPGEMTKEVFDRMNLKTINLYKKESINYGRSIG